MAVTGVDCEDEKRLGAAVGGSCVSLLLAM